MAKLIQTSSPIVIDNASKIKYDDPDYPTVKEALDKLLYVFPAINSFTLSVGTVEIGSAVPTVTASWEFNKPMTSASLTDASILPTDVSHVFSGLNLTSNKTYTLTCGDGQNSVSMNRTITFSHKRYWGVSPLNILSNEDILNLSSEFSSSKSKSVAYNCSGGNYFYFCYPTSLGVPSNVTVGGLAFSDYSIMTQAFTNASGHTSNYYIIRCNSIQTGSNINVSWS